MILVDAADTEDDDVGDETVADVDNRCRDVIVYCN